MSSSIRQLAAIIFASPSVQLVVNFRDYNPDHIARQSIVAAQAFADVASEIDLSGESTEVAVSAFCGRVGRMIIGGDRSAFIAEAQFACNLAATLETEVAKVFPRQAEFVAKPQAPAGAGEPGNATDTPEVSTKVETKPEVSTEVKVIEVDVPVEKLGLPKGVVDMLLAADMVTAKKILADDATGKVEAIIGIGPQLRAKIVAAATKALTPVPATATGTEAKTETTAS